MIKQNTWYYDCYDYLVIIRRVTGRPNNNNNSAMQCCLTKKKKKERDSRLNQESKRRSKRRFTARVAFGQKNAFAFPESKRAFGGEEKEITFTLPMQSLEYIIDYFFKGIAMKKR